MKISPNQRSRWRAIWIIIAGIFVLLAAIAVGSYFIPVKFDLNQSVSVNAPPSYLYEELNDLERWPLWSYWIDEDAQVTYGDRTEGINAQASWQYRGGERRVSIGLNMADELVRTRLEFPDLEPVTYEFRLAADTLDPSNTRLTMLMTLAGSENHLWSRWRRAIRAFKLTAAIDHDLPRLKRIAETKPIFSYGITEELLAPSYYIGTEISAESGHPAPWAIIDAQDKLQEVLRGAGVTAAGDAFSILGPDSTAGVQCGIPVPPDAQLPAAYPIRQFYSGAAIRAIDSTGYSKINAVHHEVQRYIRYRGHATNGAAWEVYITNPARTSDASRWITHVYYPVLERQAQ